MPWKQPDKTLTNAVKRKRREKKNNAGYTAIPVTCGLAGAMLEVTRPFGQ